MKATNNFSIPVLTATIIVMFAFGCKSDNNSVKDNSGDNMHQEDPQDNHLNRTDTTRRDTTGTTPDSSHTSGTHNNR